MKQGKRPTRAQKMMLRQYNDYAGFWSIGGCDYEWQTKITRP